MSAPPTTLPADGAGARRARTGAGLGSVVPLPRGRSLRVARRAVVVCGLLLVLAAALFVVTIATGVVPIPLADVARALVGAGLPADEFIVETLRLPRALAGLLVGGALGLAGAVFQSLTRNPLGSPDIIGFTSGASAGAVLQILVLGGSGLAVSGGALFGALVTGVLVYVLAFRGGVEGYRLVLVGIGLGAMFLATVDFMLTRARLEEALGAYVWLTGSLSNRDFSQVGPLIGALVVLVPLLALQSRALRQLEVGDDAAAALGVRVQPARLGLLATGVVLTAVAVAAAGPVAFVALAAPQIGRRLTRATGPNLTASALTGAVLLLGSDVAAQRLFGGDLPVGVFTGVLGGVYLIGLLAVGFGRRSA